jgi:hypothetical protein
MDAWSTELREAENGIRLLDLASVQGELRRKEERARELALKEAQREAVRREEELHAQQIKDWHIPHPAGSKPAAAVNKRSNRPSSTNGDRVVLNELLLNLSALSAQESQRQCELLSAKQASLSDLLSYKRQLGQTTTKPAAEASNNASVRLESPRSPLGSQRFNSSAIYQHSLFYPDVVEERRLNASDFRRPSTAESVFPAWVQARLDGSALSSSNADDRRH